MTDDPRNLVSQLRAGDYEVAWTGKGGLFELAANEIERLQQEVSRPAVGESPTSARARQEVMAAAHALAHGRGLGTLSSNVDRLRRAVADLEKLERTTDETPGATGGPSVVWRPMESAPLDGSEVDLWAYGKRRTDCHYHCGEWLKWASDSVDDEPHWQRIKDPDWWTEMPAPWVTVATPATDGCSSHPDTTHETPGAAGVAGGALQTPEPVWTREKDDLVRGSLYKLAALLERTGKTQDGQEMWHQVNVTFPPATQRAEDGDG